MEPGAGVEPEPESDPESEPDPEVGPEPEAGKWISDEAGSGGGAAQAVTVSTARAQSK
ncbi:hypothetical protein [Nocardia cyriacigeorgica]|uniref:hypothetical protein n=1 Tax=Nocardia cyriacigeorgica TaxID=135487 RepID=UPI00189587A5|nr:hypothetical protein [Nocardia cyriacigeorgica]MBF6436784.1 hypothetical protein [Nocardia cyriacigeorgica]